MLKPAAVPSALARGMPAPATAAGLPGADEESGLDGRERLRRAEEAPAGFA